MGSRLFLSFLPSKPMTLALRQESPAAPGRQEVPTGRGGQRGVWGGGQGLTHVRVSVTLLSLSRFCVVNKPLGGSEAQLGLTEPVQAPVALAGKWGSTSPTP